MATYNQITWNGTEYTEPDWANNVSLICLMLMSCGLSSLGGSLARASAITYFLRVGERDGDE